MTTPGDSEQPDAVDLSLSEVRRRSLAGVFYITSSGVVNLLLGFFASLVLARLLTPEDFGVVAIGSTLVLLGGALADGGIASGLIRRPQPPTRSDLRTLNGIQLAIALAVCVPSILIALGLFGRTGAVTAIMIASLPITTLQTPGRVMLVRQMRYDRQAAIDLSAQAAYQIFAVTTVALGAGVWGLATGSVVRAVVGTVLVALLSTRLMMPSLHRWREYGELVRFGLRFQAGWFTWVAREQALNIVVAVVAGVGPLGLWTFANRIFQLPAIAFSSLYAVGFPAMANLLARGEDAAPVILRAVRRAAIFATFVFPAFAAASPELIPSLFGEQWRESTDIIPFICLSTLILGSIATAVGSYLSAAGRPGVVASASAAFGVVWLAITTPLLPFVGIVAIGIGNLGGALVEAVLLDRATRSTAGVSPARPLLWPLAVALVAGTAGWIVCVAGPPGFLIAIAAGALTLALSFVGLWLTCRADLMDTIRLAGGTARSAIHLRKASAEGA